MPSSAVSLKGMNGLPVEEKSADLLGFQNLIIVVPVFFPQRLIIVPAQHDQRVEFTHDIITVGTDDNIQSGNSRWIS